MLPQPCQKPFAIFAQFIASQKLNQTTMVPSKDSKDSEFAGPTATPLHSSKSSVIEYIAVVFNYIGPSVLRRASGKTITIYDKHLELLLLQNIKDGISRSVHGFYVRVIGRLFWRQRDDVMR